MKRIVAVAQMQSGNDIDANFQAAERLCAMAKHKQANLLSFPENFAFMGSPAQIQKMTEPLTGALFSRYRELAKAHQMELSFGGFQEKGPSGRVFNSHVIVDASGTITAVYRKIHLFVANLADIGTYNEAAHIEPGSGVVVAQSSIGRLGLSICYDLRFAELYASLREKGADILLVPSAFTAETGKAHWEVLLRARAIENQCYVAAAAQFGTNIPGRVTHGHAMIIDPWGAILDQCPDQEGLAIAEIDTDYMKRIRDSMPLQKHRRPDIFNQVHDARS